MKDIPAPTGKLPEQWIHKWQEQSALTLPESWDADDQDYQVIPRRAEITEKNERMLERIIQHYE